MENEDWKYVLNLSFEHSQHPEGIKMHFNSLDDAFRKLLLIPEEAFRVGLWQAPYTGRINLKAEILSQLDQTPIVDVKYVDSISYNDNTTLGLYYRFPKGALDFEQKSGFDLSVLKGYDSQQEEVLISYLIKEKQTHFKNSLGLNALKKMAADYEQAHPQFCLSVASKYFGASNSSIRSVSVVPYVEDFFYTNANDAIKALLSVDYNKLDEYIAWEKDQINFYTKANVMKNRHSVAELLSLREGQAVGHDRAYAEGIYLNLAAPAERYGITYPLENLHPPGQSGDLMLVGKYNETRSGIYQVPELKAILAFDTNQKSPGIRSTPLPSIRKTAPMKGKKRGMGI